MRPIVMQKPVNSSLAAQVIALYETLKATEASEQFIFDLSQLTWACPLLILPISAYVLTTGSEIKMDRCEISSYLKAVRFPEGVDSATEFEQMLQAVKSYIPISVLRKDIGMGRERLESMFASIVYKQLAVTFEGVRNAIYYPIGELVTNIFEHSRQGTGFIFAQGYPKKDYLDVCIVDRGRGLRASYQEDKGITVTDDAAISEVMKGHSVKPSKERGYGVWTSKRIVCEGLGGDFVMISGSAALISSRGRDNLVSLPNFYWQGVIVAYRIPKPHTPFDISQYVE